MTHLAAFNFFQLFSFAEKLKWMNLTSHYCGSQLRPASCFLTFAPHCHGHLLFRASRSSNFRPQSRSRPVCPSPMLLPHVAASVTLLFARPRSADCVCLLLKQIYSVELTHKSRLVFGKVTYLLMHVDPQLLLSLTLFHLGALFYIYLFALFSLNAAFSLSELQKSDIKHREWSSLGLCMGGMRARIQIQAPVQSEQSWEHWVLI